MPIATKLAMKQCNFSCKYCWQKPENRKSLIDTRDFDYDKILSTMEKLYKEHDGNREIVIHGGEVTAYPRKDLETLLQKAHGLQGYTAIQTNGWKIDKYWDLFEKYDTQLGVSYDGYEEANLLRGFGNKNQRLKQSKKISENIFEALDRGFSVNTISVITRQNGIDYLNKLEEFLLDFDEAGGGEGRLNACTITEDIEKEKPPYELSIKELIDVYDDLLDFCLQHGLKYSPFKDMGRALQDKSRVCKFSPCDFYATPSLIAIHKDGSVGNCVKTYRGERRLRADEERKDIRQQLLKETDCKGCKWFPYCHGGCPNDGINGDWRRKSKYCPLYKYLWSKIDKLGRALDFKEDIETIKSGNLRPSESHGDRPHGDSEGHGDRPHGDSQEHGNKSHGDRPHGDSG